jgi:arsenite methyltransferase
MLVLPRPRSHGLTPDKPVERMIDQIEGGLTVIRFAAVKRAEALGLDFDLARSILAAARAAVADGVLGYGLLVAEKPNHRRK